MYRAAWPFDGCGARVLRSTRYAYSVQTFRSVRAGGRGARSGYRWSLVACAQLVCTQVASASPRAAARAAAAPGRGRGTPRAAARNVIRAPHHTYQGVAENFWTEPLRFSSPLDPPYGGTTTSCSRFLQTDSCVHTSVTVSRFCHPRTPLHSQLFESFSILFPLVW